MVSSQKLAPEQSTRPGLKGTLLMLISGLAVYVYESFKTAVTRPGSRQQNSTAARLESNLQFQKDMKCIQVMTLSKVQLKAEAGHVEFLSANDIPSSCSIGGWVRPTMIFDKIIGLVHTLQDQHSTIAHRFVIDTEVRNHETVRRVRLA